MDEGDGVQSVSEDDPLYWLQCLPGGEEFSVFVKAAGGGTKNTQVGLVNFPKHCYLFDDLELLSADKMECHLNTPRTTIDLWPIRRNARRFYCEEGSSMEEFVEEAGSMLKGNQLSIIETSEHTILKTLMSSVEYYYFHNLLVNAARKKKYGGRRTRRGGKMRFPRIVFIINSVSLLCVESSKWPFTFSKL